VGAVISDTGIVANTQNDQPPSAARDRAVEYPPLPAGAAADGLGGNGDELGGHTWGLPGGHTPGDPAAVAGTPNAQFSSGSAGAAPGTPMSGVAAPLLPNAGSGQDRYWVTFPLNPGLTVEASMEPRPTATASPPAKPAARPPVVRPARPARPAPRPSAWSVAPIVTWYGPGFYGNRTACGQRYTRTIIGVAHKTLPCGTLIQFRWGGITAYARVIDRGPYATSDYVFDFSAALACDVFKPRGTRNGCFTRHDVQYRVVSRRGN
jgi:hypothetical protein